MKTTTSSRWFRFYESVVDDPKVQRLPEGVFKAWVNLLCIASRNEGELSAEPSDIAFALRIAEDKAREILKVLTAAKLLDRTEAGKLTPHNWNGRQFKSDSSTSRVKRFRERSKERPEKQYEKRPNGSAKQSEDRFTEQDMKQDTEQDVKHDVHDEKPFHETAPDRQTEYRQSRQTRARAQDAASNLFEELKIRPENDPERASWPERIGQWMDGGGVVDDLLAAAKRSRGRGDAAKTLAYYLAMSEDEKHKREGEAGARGDVKSPTKDYWLTHAEVRKYRMDALRIYASDGRWTAENELPNGVWGDAFDTGAPPHDVRTKISDELLDSVPGARDRRDKILAAKGAP